MEARGWTAEEDVERDIWREGSSPRAGYARPRRQAPPFLCARGVAARQGLMVRMFSAPQERPSTIAPASPMEIPERRYAAGEITREQYQQIQEDLDGAPLDTSQKTVSQNVSDAMQPPVAKEC